VECENKSDTGLESFQKSLGQYPSNIRGKHEIKKLQKTAVLDTAHIMNKVPMQR